MQQGSKTTRHLQFSSADIIHTLLTHTPRHFCRHTQTARKRVHDDDDDDEK